MSQDIQTLIQNSQLKPNEKAYLNDRIKGMDMLEILKLRRSLLAREYPEALKGFQLMKQSFVNLENNKFEEEKKGFLKQVADLVSGTKNNKKVLSNSILVQPGLLGGPIPQAIEDPQVKPLIKLTDFYHPAQLGQIDLVHITFNNSSQNKDQVFSNFFSKLDEIFNKVPDIHTRRGYFMNYLQSPLFTNYLNTGLTALRHPELQPPKAVLNLLSQMNNTYLNRDQFKNAATLTAYIRNLCAL